jgi:hypothetical protein
MTCNKYNNQTQHPVSVCNLLVVLLHSVPIPIFENWNPKTLNPDYCSRWQREGRLFDDVPQTTVEGGRPSESFGDAPWDPMWAHNRAWWEVFALFWHKLNYFKLCKNFSIKFNPFCRNFLKHIQVANQFSTRTYLTKSVTLHPTDHSHNKIF